MRYTTRIAVALGFVGAVALAGTAVGQVGNATPSPTDKAPGLVQRKDGMRHPGRNKGLRAGKRVVHGEMKVQKGDGFATLIIDQGEVTAVNEAAKTVTLKRADGETVTVTADDQTRVREGRQAAALSDVDVGDAVRTVQIREGDTTRLRAIHVRVPRDGGAGA